LLELCDDLGQTDIRPASIEVARDQFSSLLRDTRKEAHLVKNPGGAKEMTSRLASAGQINLIRRHLARQRRDLYSVPY
jgi:hypothetical protein